MLEQILLLPIRLLAIVRRSKDDLKDDSNTGLRVNFQAQVQLLIFLRDDTQFLQRLISLILRLRREPRTPLAFQTFR